MRLTRALRNTLFWRVFCFVFVFLIIYLFTWLHWALVVALRIFSCGIRTLSCSMWDLVPWPGVEPGPSALGVRCLRHWTTGEVLRLKSESAGHLVVSNSFVTPWTVTRQAPLSVEFPRQEYWSRLPFSPLRDLPDPGIELASPLSPALQVDSLPLCHLGSPKMAYYITKWSINPLV